MIRLRTGFWQWLLAFIVSVSLWIVSMQDHVFEVRIWLPVQTPELPEDYMILQVEMTDSVFIQFSGRGIGVLRDQIFRQPYLIRLPAPEADPNRAYPQETSIQLSADNIVFRGGGYVTLSAESFSPGQVGFTLDRKISRLMPVSIQSDSHIPQRYLWWSLSNSQAQLTGAASVINRLDSCYTVPVGSDNSMAETEIQRPSGIQNITPHSVNVDLIRPVTVVSRLQDL